MLCRSDTGIALFELEFGVINIVCEWLMGLSPGIDHGVD